MLGGLQLKDLILTEMKNIDFFSVISYLTVTIPFDRAWSQEFKNVLLFVSIASYDEKSAAQVAKKGRFCMGDFGHFESLCPL